MPWLRARPARRWTLSFWTCSTGSFDHERWQLQAPWPAPLPPRLRSSRGHVAVDDVKEKDANANHALVGDPRRCVDGCQPLCGGRPATVQGDPAGSPAGGTGEGENLRVDRGPPVVRQDDAQLDRGGG